MSALEGQVDGERFEVPTCSEVGSAFYNDRLAQLDSLLFDHRVAYCWCKPYRIGDTTFHREVDH